MTAESFTPRSAADLDEDSGLPSPAPLVDLYRASTKPPKERIPDVVVEAVKREAAARILDVVGRRVGGGLKKQGKDHVGLCPFHDDKHPSLRVSSDGWFCHPCGFGGSAVDFVMKADNVDFVEAIRRLAGDLGVPLEPRPAKPEVAATYRYTDEHGAVVGVKRRWEPGHGGKAKSFDWRGPDEKAGQPDGARTLYRLPEVVGAIQAGNPVLVVEGEKCADALANKGFVVTCNDNGAGKWTERHTALLRGAVVVVLPDNDDAGRKHAAMVIDALAPVAKAVRRLDLPGLPDKGDVVDWLKAGGTVDDLRGLVSEALSRADDSDWRRDVDRALADVRAHATTTTAEALVARGAIPFQSLAELEASDLPKTRWLVSGLVTERAVAVISGEPKTAKTWVAQEIAVAVATGGRVFGEFKTGEPKPAALFLVEDGASNTRARLRGILDGHTDVNAAAKAAAAKRLSVRCLDSLDLTDEVHLARFVASVRRLPEPPAVVVLDPLRDLHTGAEDKSDDMAKVSAALRTLRNVLDAAVVFVHHAGKATETQKGRRGGQRMRGSSALHGAVDAGLHMYEPQNTVDEATRTTTMRASIESEVKAGRSAGTFGMTLVIVDAATAGDDDRGECERATFTFSRQRAAERAKDDAAERDEDTVLAALKTRHDEHPDDPQIAKTALVALVGGKAERMRAAVERLSRGGGVSCATGARGAVLLSYSPAKAEAFVAKRNPDPFGGAEITGTEVLDL